LSNNAGLRLAASIARLLSPGVLPGREPGGQLPGNSGRLPAERSVGDQAAQQHQDLCKQVRGRLPEKG